MHVTWHCSGDMAQNAGDCPWLHLCKAAAVINLLDSACDGDHNATTTSDRCHYLHAYTLLQSAAVGSSNVQQAACGRPWCLLQLTMQPGVACCCLHLPRLVVLVVCGWMEAALGCNTLGGLLPGWELGAGLCWLLPCDGPPCCLGLHHHHHMSCLLHVNPSTHGTEAASLPPWLRPPQACPAAALAGEGGEEPLAS